MENKETPISWLWNKSLEKGLSANDFQQAELMDIERVKDIIRFLRTQDKMGKSVDDLCAQFFKEQYI